MLTADLVQARIYKGEVRPRYVDADDPELLALAEQLIDTFAAHEGQPRYELDLELKDILGTGTDFLLHRALAKLLLDRCSFDTESPVDPELLRRATFEAAAEAYRTDAGEAHPAHLDRTAILGRVAAEHEMAPPEVERGLYADLKSEQVLQTWKRCAPEWLLKRYNVALAQGVLLRANQLEIRIEGETTRRYRELFRKIKFFQLLHQVEGDAESGYTLRLDGPMSLFKASGKYGVQMAFFLPTLLHFHRWQLDAELLWGKRRRASRFRLVPADGLRPINRLTGQWQPEELSWLPEQLTKLESGWNASTDAELLHLGGQGVLVPDYVFHHAESGTRVFMEVFGFWNRGAVDARLELLRRHGPPNLILALSKQLASGQEGLEELPGEVYVFRATPIARQVVKLLEKVRKESNQS